MCGSLGIEWAQDLPRTRLCSRSCLAVGEVVERREDLVEDRNWASRGSLGPVEVVWDSYLGEDLKMSVTCTKVTGGRMA